MKKLSTEFFKRVGEYMLVETPLARADMCLVFGGEQADALATKAAELYHQGYFPLIVVSGGNPTSKGELEANQMHDRLVALGVPDSVIRIEDQATNTGENVSCTMKLLKKTGEFGKINSVLGIGQIHGSRRFLMTLEKQWPTVTKMFTAPNTFGTPREEWYTDKRFLHVLLHELLKIPKYKARGFIKEIDMDALAKKIKALPAPKPPKPSP